MLKIKALTAILAASALSLLSLAPLQADTVTVEDLVMLLETGFSDDTILTFLDTQEYLPELDAWDLTRLREAGASEVLINYLLAAQAPAAVSVYDEDEEDGPTVIVIGERRPSTTFVYGSAYWNDADWWDRWYGRGTYRYATYAPVTYAPTVSLSFSSYGENYGFSYGFSWRPYWRPHLWASWYVPTYASPWYCSPWYSPRTYVNYAYNSCWSYPDYRVNYVYKTVNKYVYHYSGGYDRGRGASPPDADVGYEPPRRRRPPIAVPGTPAPKRPGGGEGLRRARLGAVPPDGDRSGRRGTIPRPRRPHYGAPERPDRSPPGKGVVEKRRRSDEAKGDEQRDRRRKHERPPRLEDRRPRRGGPPILTRPSPGKPSPLPRPVPGDEARRGRFGDRVEPPRARAPRPDPGCTTPKRREEREEDGPGDRGIRRSRRPVRADEEKAPPRPRPGVTPPSLRDRGERRRAVHPGPAGRRRARTRPKRSAERSCCGRTARRSPARRSTWDARSGARSSR